MTAALAASLLASGGVCLAITGITRWVVERHAHRTLDRIAAVALVDCPPNLRPEIHDALADFAAGLGLLGASPSRERT
jgi:hypothetical protein